MYLAFFIGMYPLGPSVKCCILRTVYITCSLPLEGTVFYTVLFIQRKNLINIYYI